MPSLAASKRIPRAWRDTLRRKPVSCAEPTDWDWYRFDPVASINALELALLVRKMRDIGLPLLVPQGTDLRRHFLLDDKRDIGRNFARIMPDRDRYPQVVYLTKPRQ